MITLYRNELNIVNHHDIGELYLSLALALGDDVREIKQRINGSLTEWRINFMTIEKARTLQRLREFCCVYCSPKVIDLIQVRVRRAIETKQDVKIINCESRMNDTVCCIVSLACRDNGRLCIDAHFLSFECSDETRRILQQIDTYKSHDALRQLTKLF